MLNAVLLTLAIGQTANVGTLLATRGTFTYMGWDGAAKKSPKLGDQISLADEISTEGDGSVKASLAQVAVVTLGASTKISFDKLEGTALQAKLAYGRARLIVTPERPVSVSLTTDGGVVLVSDGDVVVIVEGGKTQVVVLGGSAMLGKTKLAAGVGCDSGGAPYSVTGASVQALRRSLELDETPAAQIAQSLETDLPGFVGPKSGHIRWRGMAETVGESSHLAPPFEQYPAGAITH